MRIVVSTIGTPPYKVSEYLVKLINPILQKSVTYLKNSSTFVSEAKSWTIDHNELQVSYDAVNLYPSVPIKKAINVMMDMLSREQPYLSEKTKLTLNDIKSLLDLCLKKCYFLWNTEIRTMENAGPIGLSLMVVIAEAFLQFIEQKAIALSLQKQPTCTPLSYKRYVDDSHARFKQMYEANNFLDILNSIDPKIQFTVETEDENKLLNFLDITIQNNLDVKYTFNVYRKEAITNVQIKTNSSVPPNLIYGVFKGFLSRAKRVCSSKNLNQEFEFLKTIFSENGHDIRKLNNII